MSELLVGVFIAAILLGMTLAVIQTVREGSRLERTLSTIYLLKEEIRRTARTQGSYTQGRMMPLLFASRSFPDTLDVDYERRIVTTPLGQPLDVTGRGAHFSIDMADFSPNDCYDFGMQIINGNYFMLGNTVDDLDIVKIGDATFTDATPITPETLQHACTARSSIDVIMAFR